jgi:hypothetical protein
MLHKFISRSAVFAMATLASLGASAHDGADGQVTLTADSYKLWTNAGSGNVIRISLRVPDYYNASQNCNDVDSYMVASTLPADVRQRIYTTLLSAKLAGKPVRLYIDTNNCEDNRPRVVNVTIE